MELRQLKVSTKREKGEIEQCLSTFTKGYQFFFFEFKSAMKGLKSKHLFILFAHFHTIRHVAFSYYKACRFFIL